MSVEVSQTSMENRSDRLHQSSSKIVTFMTQTHRVLNPAMYSSQSFVLARYSNMQCFYLDEIGQTGGDN
jgi:hypothetical protein